MKKEIKPVIGLKFNDFTGLESNVIDVKEI